MVWEHRSPENTTVRIKEVSEIIDGFPFYENIQEIRQNEQWFNQAPWLKESTQATLELYNPIVMSKMFMLHDASIFNPPPLFCEVFS